MDVTIRLNLPLQRLAGNQELIRVSGSTVKQCLQDLIRKVPGSESHVFNKDGSSALLILLNNAPLPSQNLNYPLSNGDELWLLSMVGGG